MNSLGNLGLGLVVGLLIYWIHYLISGLAEDSAVRKAEKIMRLGPRFRFMCIEKGLIPASESSHTRKTFKTKVLVMNQLGTPKVLRVEYPNKFHYDYEAMERLEPGQTFRYIFRDDPDHPGKNDDYNYVSRYLKIYEI